jgi:hypothetical protein
MSSSGSPLGLSLNPAALRHPLSSVLSTSPGDLGLVRVATLLEGLGLEEGMQVAPSWVAAESCSPLDPGLLTCHVDDPCCRHRACRPPVAVFGPGSRPRTSGAAGDVARTQSSKEGESLPSSPIPLGLVPSSDLRPPMPLCWKEGEGEAR